MPSDTGLAKHSAEPSKTAPLTWQVFYKPRMLASFIDYAVKYAARAHYFATQFRVN
jgi:hypothetical protein